MHKVYHSDQGAESCPDIPPWNAVGGFYALLRPFLLFILTALFPRLPQGESVPADPVLREFVQRVRSEVRIGDTVAVTDEMFSGMRETMKEFPKVCTAPHRL
jgi:hypothetical protein